MKKFLKGLASFAISGSATTVITYMGSWATASMTSPGSAPPISGKTVGILALAGGIVGLANYLKDSPAQVEKQ